MLRFSRQIIEFLDVQISLENGRFKTELYTKDTDGYLYLHKSSNHPRKTKDAILYGLGVRLKRICATDEDYTVHRKELKDHLSKRGYNNNNFEKTTSKSW